MKTLVYVLSKKIMNKLLHTKRFYNLFVREPRRAQHTFTNNNMILVAKYLQGRKVEVGTFNISLPLSDGCTSSYTYKN